MIQINTMLKIVDNSGAKIVMCIKLPKGFKRRYATIGDLIAVSVKSLRSKRRAFSNVKKGEICNALIVRTKNRIRLFSGETFSFLENSVILFNRQKKFLFTRIFGSLPIMIRYTRYMRVLSMSSGFLN